MARSPSSTRKLAKVARSSKGSSIRERSDRTFPLAIAAIVVVGSLLVVYGRSQRANAQDIQPRLALDHWHAAYGLYICGTFQPVPTDRNGDEVGIHTHDDNVIHIHPSSSAAAGDRATIGLFFDEVGLSVENGTIVTPDGQRYDSGETTCPDGTVGQTVLVAWPSADDPNAPPTMIRGDINDTVFERDRMAFTLAFVPEDQIAGVPRPESIPTLDNLTDVAPAPGAPLPTGPLPTGPLPTGPLPTAPVSAPSTGPSDTSATTTADGVTTTTPPAPTTAG